MLGIFTYQTTILDERIMIGTEKDSQKRMIGELLKAADRYIKSAEWPKALAEVGKALAIEPNNMYAKAYKDRIDVSLNAEKKKIDAAKSTKEVQSPDPVTDGKKPEAGSSDTPPLSDDKKTELKSAEASSESQKTEKTSQDTKSSILSPSSKDESTARVDALRHEFATIQAKLQREVAQLTMQVKEAQALKEATEKRLTTQLVSAQKELSTAKQLSLKNDPKELEGFKKELEDLKKEKDSIKAKHQKELESSVEITKAEMLTQVAVLQKELDTAKAAAGEVSLQKQGELILKSMFSKAWQDGLISNDERGLLLVLKGAIELTESKFGELESGAKNDAYINALKDVWSDGVVTPDESDFLTALREKLDVPADEHFRLESKIRKEVKK